MTEPSPTIQNCITYLECLDLGRIAGPVWLEYREAILSHLRSRVGDGVDAARYRWLRSGKSYGECGIYVADGGHDWRGITGKNLDKRIDAHLTKERA